MIKKAKTKFLRRTWKRYSKLGKGRKKKQVWRKPTGRDNKMREKRKGYPVVVSIGYSSDNKIKGKIKGKTPVLINNVKDLEKIKQNQIAIVGNVGKKKKIDIVKKANEKKILLQNINIKKFSKKIEKEAKKKIDKNIEEDRSKKEKSKKKEVKQKEKKE